MRRAVAVVIVVAALAALFAFGWKPRDDRDVASVRLRKPMPDFEAPVLPGYVAEYGESLRLSDYLGRGRPILVNVWASWCEACVAEAPRLRDARERHHSRLMMIGIDFQDRPVSGEAFVERFDHGFPSVSDPRGRIGIDWGASIGGCQGGEGEDEGDAGDGEGDEPGAGGPLEGRLARQRAVAAGPEDRDGIVGTLAGELGNASRTAVKVGSPDCPNGPTSTRST